MGKMTDLQLDKNDLEEIKSFEELNLNENLLKGIYSYGFEKPSIIQQKGIQAILTGRDCIIQAQSGTGKTATFLLSALNMINAKEKHCQVLIVSPTRELASQI